jgi:hypothetical protein
MEQADCQSPELPKFEIRSFGSAPGRFAQDFCRTPASFTPHLRRKKADKKSQKQSMLARPACAPSRMHQAQNADQVREVSQSGVERSDRN